MPVQLRSSDGKVFVTDDHILQCSDTIKTMLDVCQMFEDDDGIVPLADINADTLSRVLRWTEYHYNNQQPFGASHGDDAKWYADFVDVDHGTLLQLLSAARILNIRDLAEFIIADIITCRTEQIRAVYSIADATTAADIELVRNENGWTESYV